jgi:hypothetical protein
VRESTGSDSALLAIFGRDCLTESDFERYTRTIMLIEMSAGLNRQICDRAWLARDSAYDGLFFTGVRTTRTHRRPVCQVRPAKSENVLFFPTAAVAERAGCRPRLRCRPETAWQPGMEGTATTVARGMPLIETGFLESLDGIKALVDGASLLGSSRSPSPDSANRDSLTPPDTADAQPSR